MPQVRATLMNAAELTRGSSEFSRWRPPSRTSRPHDGVSFVTRIPPPGLSSAACSLPWRIGCGPAVWFGPRRCEPRFPLAAREWAPARDDGGRQQGRRGGPFDTTGGVQARGDVGAALAAVWGEHPDLMLRDMGRLRLRPLTSTPRPTLVAPPQSCLVAPGDAP
jgi:hypothetical protein